MTPLRYRLAEALGNRLGLVMEGDFVRCGSDQADVARRACTILELDGLLLMSPPRPGGGAVMRVLNRDGSEGGICFNGLRAAALLGETEEGMFEMDGHRIGWRRTGEDLVELHLSQEELPREMTFRAVTALGLQGMSVPFWNPHVVFPVEDLDAVDLPKLAKACTKQTDLFPNGVNVEVIVPAGEHGIRMRVHERGVGETASCGSAAVSVALSAWAGGRPNLLAVTTRGGTLALAPSSSGGLFLAGPANLGEMALQALDTSS